MGPITIGVAISALVFMVFVAFFGRLPALRNTPIASLYAAIWVHIPEFLLAVDRKLTGGLISSRLSRVWNATLYDRHPTVLIFFLLLLVGGEALYLPSAWPRFTPFHKVAGTIAMTVPYVSLYFAAAGDPGYVSSENVEDYRNLYPYDFTLFHPGQECRTCRILKPARSKHCQICKRCVARSDHHCVFINKCVGYRNHRWFVVLLFSTAVLTAYGGYVGFSLQSAKIRARYPAWTIFPPPTMTWSRYFAMWSWSMQGAAGMGAVSLLAALISPMVWGFALYTLYMLYRGMTTNENLKWLDWKDEVADGVAFRRPMLSTRNKDARFEGPESRWPKEASQILVATARGRPPTNPNVPGYGAWEKVESLKTVDNLYDLGLWGNLLDVFVHDYPFRSRDPELPPRSKGRLRRRAVGSVW